MTLRALWVCGGVLNLWLYIEKLVLNSDSSNSIENIIQKEAEIDIFFSVILIEFLPPIY